MANVDLLASSSIDFLSDKNDTIELIKDLTTQRADKIIARVGKLNQL